MTGSADPPRAFLRVPPFPGATVRAFGEAPDAAGDTLADHADLLRSLRVGGTFWAAQPDVPPQSLLVRDRAALRSCDDLPADLGKPLLWRDGAPNDASGPVIVGPCDPWHVLAQASALVCSPDDEARVIAALLGLPVFLHAPGAPLHRDSESAEALLRSFSPLQMLANPFTGLAMPLAEAICLCGYWRDLIDGNRDLAGGVGFAGWKQAQVAAMLWSGGEDFRFFGTRPRPPVTGKLAMWRARAPVAVLAAIEADGTRLVEVEDGFLRSNGLGADCVPPLSITVDRSGPYFDPAQPSELEAMLQTADFDAALLARAAALRLRIVAEGLGKYERGAAPLPRFGGDRHHILVPGQVEDDRSVLAGGAGLVSNADLLARVRAAAPDAFILYKPHPDVLAGHRKGLVPAAIGDRLADRIVDDLPISSLLDMVDEVQVNTSLAGFEALLRHKSVVTHGVPFYAGWGLTRDLGPVPARRRRTLALDELVAATLLLYPRYLDPVTGLPCPAEIVVQRLCAPQPATTGPLVAARRLQGRMMRRLRSLWA
jgi:capsular polysaccharide export protein